MNRPHILVTVTADPDAVLPRPRDIDAWRSAWALACGHKGQITGQWRVSWQGDGFLWEKIA